MMVEQRSGSGMDLEPMILDDMGLAHVQFRNSGPRVEVPLRKPREWSNRQGRGFVEYAPPLSTESVVKRLLAGIVVLLCAVLANHFLASRAQAQTVGLHLFSKHGNETHAVTHEGGADTVEKFNNKNFGAYYMHTPVDLFGFSARPTAGAFNNSYEHLTVYAGVNRDWKVWGPLSVGATAALATGYEMVHGVGKVRVVLMPHAVLALPKEVAVRLSATPAKGGAFIHLGIEKGL